MKVKLISYQLILFLTLSQLCCVNGYAQVKAQLGGRLFIDGGAYINAPDTFAHAAGIPDVRLRGVLKLNDGWSTKIDVKFANNKVSLSDAFVQKIHKQHVFRAGFMFGFFGLDQSYSTNDYPFLTGSNIAETFYPGRRTGISYNYSGERFYFATGAFMGDKLKAENKKQGFNTTARIVYRPIFQNGNILHVGTSVFYRVPDQDKLSKDRSVLFSNTANTYISAPSVFNTAITGVESQYQWGIETLGIFKRLFFQSEFMLTAVERKDNPTFHAYGGYAELGWLFKGKMLNYDSLDAVPYCTSEPNTLMLFARYNLSNLNDTEIKCGKLHDIAIGLNYYLNDYVVFRLNYSHQWTDVYSSIGKENWGLLQGRVQFKF